MQLPSCSIPAKPFQAWFVRTGEPTPGTITAVEAFPEARKPAYKLTIDFGPEIGTKRSSAQITRHYVPDELIGKQVLAVVNFPPRQIGPVRSEVLVLGLPDEDNQVVLIGPDKPVPLGGRMF